MIPEFSLALVLVLIASTSILYSLHGRANTRPPGPGAYPFVGSLLSFPLNYPWKRFANGAENGDLIYYHGLGNSILVLNSLESNIDLLVRRGTVYSGRPHFVVACELLDLVKSVALLPIGAYWRLQRRFSRTAFNPKKVNRYHYIMSVNASELSRSLVGNPEAFVGHVRLAVGRTLMNMVYGIEVQSPDDPYISRPKQSMDFVRRALVPGAFLVDLVPILNCLPRWTPFMNFRKEASRGRDVIAENVNEPFNRVKRNIESGIAVPSFTADVLMNVEFAAEREQMEEFELNLKWASASMFAAGQEVISAVILNMILAMSTHPEKLKKAQTELKSVLGARTPTIKDCQNLPYIRAVIKETLRWRPPLPVSIVRSSSQDNVYRGYLIPRNTMVIPNLWAISRVHDSEYPPETFAPERFLTESPAIDPSTYVFGFGRRICPGRALSDDVIFILAANILRLDITHCFDENGREIPIDVTYPPGFLSFPRPFRCHFRPSEGK
ncbi:O-methylsterigmatocystin oxidoreductase [Termitomyces sp. T112]|nr:O-methylsterigmatocystin oxidoreductase [Termitomyces sp. T112]